MSRSYKKNPVYKDRNPYNKKRANRKVRRSKHLSDGCHYKRLFPQWDICDYWTRETREGWLKDIISDYRSYLNCPKTRCYYGLDGKAKYVPATNPLKRPWATIDHWERFYLRK